MYVTLQTACIWAAGALTFGATLSSRCSFTIIPHGIKNDKMNIGGLIQMLLYKGLSIVTGLRICVYRGVFWEGLCI